MPLHGASPREASWSERLARSLRSPVFGRVAFALLAVFCGIELMGPLWLEGRVDESVLGDFAINLSKSAFAVRTGAYPESFYYAPPFVVFADALLGLGFAAAAAIGLPLLLGGALAAPRLTLLLLDRWPSELRAGMAVGIVLPVLYYVQWDLRATNANLLVLSCVLASACLGERGRPAAAGGLLASAIALKLYSVVLLPYLLWRGARSWLGWTVLWLVVGFVVLPWVRFGPDLALSLSSEWIAAFARVGDPLALPDYYKSFERSMLLVFGDGAAIRMLSMALLVAWVAGVAVALWRGRDAEGRTLRDLGVLLLAPLLASPTFQPHHAVVALLASAWGLRIALDDGQPTSRRGWAGGLLVVAWALVKIVDDWPARALAIHAALGLYLAVLCILPARPRGAPGGPSPSASP